MTLVIWYSPAGSAKKIGLWLGLNLQCIHEGLGDLPIEPLRIILSALKEG